MIKKSLKSLIKCGWSAYPNVKANLGDVDTDKLAQKLLPLKKTNLCFIVEVVDLTGWLDCYNFSFCWLAGVSYELSV